MDHYRIKRAKHRTMLSDLLLQAPTRAIAVLVWFDMDRNVAHIKSLFIKQTQMEMAGTEERER